jgi:hypothetical protein
MSLGLTLELMLAVFERYNLAIWPMQVIAYLLGIAAVFLAVKRTRYSSKAIAAILSFYWLWTGVVFCAIYWAPSYTFAYAFGALCIVQGALFLAAGVFKPDLSFAFGADVYSTTGILLVVYATVGYPIVGYLLGHRYPQSLPFGLVPYPTTVFTFGLLLWTGRKVPKYLLIIPLLWAISGFLPVSIGILEDIGLIIAGSLGTGLILHRDRKAIAMETQRQASGRA